jgi:bacteriocin-like protein
MNNAFDLNNINDFKKMCSCGEVTPNKTIKVSNLTGDKVLHRPFINHATMICKNNKTNLLDLLTNINDDTLVNMTELGNNFPSFKTKVNKVISEWPYEATYDDIFRKPEESSFNYNDILKCNQSVIHLNKDMNQLEDMIKNSKGNTYDKVLQLQKQCLDCKNQIGDCSRNIEELSDKYEPEYPKVLMDLSTRQKPFYLHKDDDRLVNLSNEYYYKDIPDKISDMIGNCYLIPNMISKESEYLKSILNKLNRNVGDKQQSLQKILSNTPEERKESRNPIEKFIYSLMNSDSDSDEETGRIEERINYNNEDPGLQKMKSDSKIGSKDTIDPKNLDPSLVDEQLSKTEKKRTQLGEEDYELMGSFLNEEEEEEDSGEESEDESGDEDESEDEEESEDEDESRDEDEGDEDIDQGEHDDQEDEEKKEISDDELESIIGGENGDPFGIQDSKSSKGSSKRSSKSKSKSKSQSGGGYQLQFF